MAYSLSSVSASSSWCKITQVPSYCQTNELQWYECSITWYKPSLRKNSFKDFWSVVLFGDSDITTIKALVKQLFQFVCIPF